MFKANEKYTMSKKELAELESELIDQLRRGFAAMGIKLAESTSSQIKIYKVD